MISKIPIRLLIPSLLLSFAGIIVVVGYLYLIPYGDKEVEDENRIKINQIMNVMQSSINILSRRNDMEGVNIQLRSLSTDASIDAVLLLNNNLSVELANSDYFLNKNIRYLYDADILATASEALKRNSGIVKISSDRNSMIAAFPVFSNNKNSEHGLLLMLVNISTMKLEEQIVIENQIVVFSSMIIFLAFIMALFFHFVISRKVDELVKNTKNISNGNFSISNKFQGNNELCQLGLAINQMAKKLEKNNELIYKNENRLRLSHDVAKIGTWEWDMNNSELFWSNQIWLMYGYKCKENIGEYKTYLKHIHNDDKEMVERQVQAAIKNHSEYNVQYRINTVSGTICWLHTKGSVIHNPSDNTNNMVGITLDITTQKELELDYQDAILELHYHKFALDQHAIVSMTDKKGLITYVNDRFCETSQYTRQELIGKTHYLVNSKTHSDSFFKEMWETISSGETWRGEITNKHKDGKLYSVDTTIVPHIDATGIPDRYIAIRSDVTSRKIFENNLHKEKEFLNALLENINEGILACDENGALSVFNRSIREYYGLPDHPIAAEDWDMYFDLYHSDGETLMTKEQAPLYRALHGEVIKDMEFYIAPKNTKKIIALASGRAFYDQKNKKLGAVITIQNVTEKNDLQQRLQQTQKLEAIGQLTGGVAHDFNNILACIMGYCNLAIQRYVDDKDSRLAKYLTEINTASERGRDLISQMMIFSRSGHHSFEKKSLSVAPIVKESLKMLRSAIPVTIALKTDFDDDLALILMDATQLSQIMVNLCINSRDAIKDKGTILIGLKQVKNIGMGCTSCKDEINGEYIALTVHDTGHGIDKTVASQIFDPFFTTKEIGKGTGMGLSTVHGIVHEFNGHIIFQSNQKTGTVFTLLFPIINDKEVISNKDLEVVDDFNLDVIHKNILIVDDERVLATMLGEVFELNGYNVKVFSDSTAALTYYKEHAADVDLIVSDQTMPGLTGVEFAKKIHDIKNNIPVIICTGYSDVIDSSNFHDFDIQGLINKPIEPKNLLNLTNKLLH